MNRRDFSKAAGLVAVTAAIAPGILAQDQDSSGGSGIVKPTGEAIFLIEDDYPTPAQRAAIQRMEENMPSAEIFEKVASEFPRQVPEFVQTSGSIVKSMQHGNVRIVGFVGGLPASAFDYGYHYGENEERKSLSDVDLNDISYGAFYRQAVRNKYTNKPDLFVAPIPLGAGAARQVNPGSTMQFAKMIIIGTPVVEIERMARESFSKLQELVVEYYNHA